MVLNDDLLGSNGASIMGAPEKILIPGMLVCIEIPSLTTLKTL
jgi:hypothetical protein